MSAITSIPSWALRTLVWPVAFASCAGCFSSSRPSELQGASDAGAERTERTTQPPLPIVDLGDESSDELFDPSALRTFELRLSEQDLAFLDADPKAEVYVPGELVFEGQRITPVGIRYKGSQGAFVGCLSNGYFPATGSKTCPKLSMKIKVDYEDDESKFFGQKKLLFHAMNGDRSLMRERLGYGLYRELGVYAPRAVHVRLLINGKLSGLFLLVEEVDGRFTRSRFSDGGRGNLYKEVWPVTDDPARYLAALETNRDENPSADKMNAFARALDGADDEALPGVVAAHMDTAYAARFVAVDRTIRHDDGPFHWYCQAASEAGNSAWHYQQPFAGRVCGNHNYYWYEDTEAQRLWPVPWDLDGSMANRDGYTVVRSAWDNLASDCTRTLGGSSAFGFGSPAQMPITCNPLQRAWALSLRREIHAAMRELVTGPFSEESVRLKLLTWAQQVAPAVVEAAATYAREPNMAQWTSELVDLQTTTARLRDQAWASAMQSEPTDAGVSDAGVSDAGVRDAGVSDAGVSDAGVRDAGMADAGSEDASSEQTGMDAQLETEASPPDAESQPSLDAASTADAEGNEQDGAQAD